MYIKYRDPLIKNVGPIPYWYMRHAGKVGHSIESKTLTMSKEFKEHVSGIKVANWAII